MERVEGTYENGIIFAETIEDAARDQVQTMLNSPIAENSHARFMPDMHAGAGRIMSRAVARKNLSVEDFQASMKGIVSDTVCLETIDEAPMAYKNWEEIAELIFPTVTIVDHWKEVFNYKATEN